MADLTQKKVLIIEDDEHISKIYNIKLKMEGINVVLARDGVEGVEKFESENPDLILLDLMIPKKDGFEVLQDIKKTERGGNVPVVVLSNLGQQSDVDKAMSLGATEYIVKVGVPFQEVIDKVRAYLEAK